MDNVYWSSKFPCRAPKNWLPRRVACGNGPSSAHTTTAVLHRYPRLPTSLGQTGPIIVHPLVREEVDPSWHSQHISEQLFPDWMSGTTGPAVCADIKHDLQREKSPRSSLSRIKVYPRLGSTWDNLLAVNFITIEPITCTTPRSKIRNPKSTRLSEDRAT